MNADRNLLWGVLALQNNFIDRQQLVAAFDRWVTEKKLGLPEILVASKTISEDERRLVDALVDRHVLKNGGDAQASLAAISSMQNLAVDLKRVNDQDLQASIVHLAKNPPAQPAPQAFATIVPSLTAQSSSSRFRVLRPHARGGLGEVFVANDEELHRNVALKQIRDAHADNEDSRTRFLVEAEITGALEHPGIVPIYGCGHYPDGRPYYAMRFIRGDSLQEAIRIYHDARKKNSAGGDSFALRGLIGRFIDVCEAIEYAHCRGILHRDLKPGNVMLGRYGETLVVDWGLACTTENPGEQRSVRDEEPIRPVSGTGTQQTEMGTAIGTPHYMSPEQADGRIDILGPQSDVYSLGATLFCVLTGEAPIVGDSVAEILERVRAGNVRSLRELNPHVEKPLAAICEHAMQRDYKLRYQRAIELANDLQRWLADEPVSVFPENFLVRAGRWARRHRMAVAVGTLATLILLVATGVSHLLVSAAHRREMIAHREAEESFRAARSAVDQYFTDISENSLLNQPGLQTLRRDLLLDGRKYYQAFLERHRSNPDLLNDLSISNFNLGRIDELLGNWQAALDHYDAALAILDNLVKSVPDKLAIKSLMSDVLTGKSRTSQSLLKLDESLRFNRQALELRQEIADVGSPEVEPHRKLASSYMNAGILQLRQNDRALARTSMEKAQSIREQWLQKSDSRLVRRDYAKGFYNLGLLEAEEGNTAEADSAFTKAVSIFEELLKDSPIDLEITHLLATCLRTLGDSKAGQSDPSLALQSYQRSQKYLASLASRNPEVFEYRMSLAGLMMNIASQQAATASNESLASIDTAIQLLIELGDQQGTDVQRRDLAVAYRARAELVASDNKTQALKDCEQAEQILADLIANGTTQVEYAEELDRVQSLKKQLQIQ